MEIEENKTEPVVIRNYKSRDNLNIGPREIKTVEFHRSEFEKIPSELLDHTELENVMFNFCRFICMESLEQLKTCQNLTELTLQECNLHTVPDFLSEFHALKSLNMSWNSFEEGLADSMTKLRSLETLDVSNCDLKGFPLALSNFRTLKMLNIKNNVDVKRLSESLENLTNLETLNVSRCGLTEFPQVLYRIKSLKVLDIGWNDKFQNLPEGLENLTKLETLNVRGCNLPEFPHVLCKLKSLKVLDIRVNDNIRNLPESLERLVNLETLNVSNCGLAGFPQVLCKLQSLKALYIGANDEIQNLPGSLKSLTNLETLNLGGCGLIEFPRVLFKLKSLKTLDIVVIEITGEKDKIYGTKNTEMQSTLEGIQKLNISGSLLKELPSFIFEMKWLHTLIISGTSFTSLPRTIERCKCLEVLDISHCHIKVFPTVIFSMKNLSTVKAAYVRIDELDENFVKLWLQRPDIFTYGRFQKMEGHYYLQLVIPPNEIVKRGPEACMRYYRALKADDAVNCSMLNVAVMGKTNAGKSSLIHSMKERASVLVDPSDRTVVVDTVEVKHENALLKFVDFGGHDVYQITYPLFLKSAKQAAIMVVKLSEYTESNQNELVTKWLATAVSNMKSGSICIVATQCDLCSEQEVKVKMNTLKRKVNNWFEEELLFWKKLRSHQPRIAPKNILLHKNICYFQTSSLNMEGVTDVAEFLFREAKSRRSVIPSVWADVYKKIDEQTEKETKFITDAVYQSLFKETTTFPWNILPQSEESVQCLQFLHDSGMVLWYGEKHKKLKKIIFHRPSFPVTVLQSLFRHDLGEFLTVYDYEKFGEYFTAKSNFLDEIRRFTQTGIFNPVLLRCIWKEFEFSQEVFDTMVEMLKMLDLCYVDEQGPDHMFRLPWFVQDAEMEFLAELWPKKLPPNTLQYTLTYCFCHRIPGVIYERFCVRLQHHLQKGGYTRMDKRDAVYIEQNAVQVLFNRHPHNPEPCMQIHLRCSIENLLPLQKLCLSLHKEMDNLCKEYPGLYIDCYFLCPHCLLTGSTTPTKRPTTDIVTDHKTSLELVPCDPHSPGSVQIPAALIFLLLLGT